MLRPEPPNSGTLVTMLLRLFDNAFADRNACPDEQARCHAAPVSLTTEQCQIKVEDLSAESFRPFGQVGCLLVAVCTVQWPGPKCLLDHTEIDLRVRCAALWMMARDLTVRTHSWC